MIGSLCVAGLGACAAVETGPSASQKVNALADRVYRDTLARTPEVAYFAGVEIDRHDGLTDNSPAAYRRAEQVEDEFLAALSEIDSDELVGSPEWIVHAYLHEQLNASLARRVCRAELWNVNQMSGWQLGYPALALRQPVGSAELREQALTRFAKFPVYIDNEIANLRRGLGLGYSSPRSVVRRVIAQLDGIVGLSATDSPFHAPAKAAGDEAFGAALVLLIEEEIHPAIARYREFLANEYLDRARDELSVTANPDGRACYEAALRGYTTLTRSGEDVFGLGEKTVAANRAAVIELGQKAYGVDGFAAVVTAAKSDERDRFSDKEELLQFSKDAVARAERAMPAWVGRMPAQPVEVVPFAAHEEGTGRSAHYRPGDADRPGEYRIPLHEPGKQSRGNAETVAFHETWPGHHLQVATSQSQAGLHPVTRLFWFSGPGEGWARYSEALADEMGLYETVTGPIFRRAWPARGMVVDPGIHLFGWSREQAIDFMMEAGRFGAARAEEMVDRIAILPGQLTAYDSGGLEILALRRQAEDTLGERFDIRQFHDRVLENGTIPLNALRLHIEAWLDREADQR